MTYSGHPRNQAPASMRLLQKSIFARRIHPPRSVVTSGQFPPGESGSFEAARAARNLRMGLALIVACVAVAWTAEVVGADWPCWRGPNRNGVSSETGWSWRWETNGPPVRWRAAVGKGFSSFAVANGRAYTMGNSNNTDTVYCFEALTGRVLWSHSYPCDPQPLSYEGGPGSTPAIHGSCVYTFSKEGHLFSLEAKSGKMVWSRQFELWPRQPGDWMNTWRYAGSPLVLGDRLYLSVGRSGTALNPKDGTTLWQSPAGHPGYSSPVPFDTPSGQALAFFSGHEVVGVEAASGLQLWALPWKTLWDLNAADPVIFDNKMFVSSGNGVGCALFDLRADPPRELWRNKNLKTLMNSSIFWKGALFGFNDQSLSCLDCKNGEERWSTPEVRKGSLSLADGKLVLLSETGRLVVAEASSSEYRPLARAQILEGRCWSTPVLSDGLLFVRNATGDVVCLDLNQPGLK